MRAKKIIVFGLASLLFAERAVSASLVRNFNFDRSLKYELPRISSEAARFCSPLSLQPCFSGFTSELGEQSLTLKFLEQLARIETAHQNTPACVQPLVQNWGEFIEIPAKFMPLYVAECSEQLPLFSGF